MKANKMEYLLNNFEHIIEQATEQAESSFLDNQDSDELNDLRGF